MNLELEVRQEVKLVDEIDSDSEKSKRNNFLKDSEVVGIQSRRSWWGSVHCCLFSIMF